MVLRVPIQSVKNAVEFNRVQQSVDWFNNLDYKLEKMNKRV